MGGGRDEKRTCRAVLAKAPHQLLSLCRQCDVAGRVRLRDGESKSERYTSIDELEVNASSKSETPERLFRCS